MQFIEELPSLFEYQKVTRELNLQAITVWVSPQSFVIVPNLSRSRIPTTLSIDRASTGITELPRIQENDTNGAKAHFFSCLLGVLDLKGKKIMVLGENVTIVACIGQRDIFKVTKIMYLFYDPNHKKNLSEEEGAILLSITAVMEEGMYFSYSYDLAERISEGNGPPLHNKTFNWAHHLQLPLQPFDSLWRVSLIQGFVGRMELHINGIKLCIVLISRRTAKRGGTQSFATGLDEQGNAGNYVQTEQILTTKDFYFSFTQSRGSAPVMWSEEKSNYGLASVHFKGSLAQNYSSFCEHLKMVHRGGYYQNIFLINLLASSKEEKKIVENYEYLVKMLVNEERGVEEKVGCEVNYAYFDAHAECSGNDYSKMNQFIAEELGGAIRHCGFTALKINRSDRRIESLQSQQGILRVNCYTCIDRSNIFQARVASLKLVEILNYLDIEVGELGVGLVFFNKSTPFANMYRSLWADNADALSKQYTGTGSTESFAVRKGKLSYMTTLDHGMKSIARVIRNLRNQDYHKQLAIRHILGDFQDPPLVELSQLKHATSLPEENSKGYQRIGDVQQSS